MFEKLVEVKQLLEEVETACNAGRVLHPQGETWQDMAYFKAHEARRLIERVLGEAMDKILPTPPTATGAEERPKDGG